MSRRPPERDVAPVTCRMRLRYAKRGRLRFASHRDFQRAFERALRRAGVPIAFSAGFSPHPRVSYANAAPTGAASEAEYLEIGLTRNLDPDMLRTTLDASLPPGLDVVDVVVARTPDFVARLEASLWQIDCPGVPPGEAQAACVALLATEHVEVERMTKNGRRRFDVRPAVVRLRADASESGGEAPPCAILRLVVRNGTPSVRPDDVLAALAAVAHLTPPVPPLVTRLAQGPLSEDAREVLDPFEADRGVEVVGA